MTLAEYLARAPRGALTRLATATGASHVALIRYRDGHYTPRVDVALRIAGATRGAVPVTSWTQPREPGRRGSAPRRRS